MSDLYELDIEDLTGKDRIEGRKAYHKMLRTNNQSDIEAFLDTKAAIVGVFDLRNIPIIQLTNAINGKILTTELKKLVNAE